MYAVISTALTVGCGLAAYAWLPLQAAWSPVWLAYVPLRLALHRLYHFVSYRLVHRVSHKSSPCLLSLSPPVSAHTGMRWWRAPVRRARGW